MNKNQIIIIITIIIIIGVTSISILRNSSKEKFELRIISNQGENVDLMVEIADDSEELQQGLMHRETLGVYEGMLFVFQTSDYHSFWMENTPIPLSIAFINSNKTIVDIQDMEAYSREVHLPQSPCLYALEVNQGFFENHGIMIGDNVILPSQA
ncbi:MAG: DUF192 domain-containing protein [Hadesarchaea archaeon]|nr:DUF192 domain-containing protein [Hadesarchaea archaeon]